MRSRRRAAPARPRRDDAVHALRTHATQRFGRRVAPMAVRYVVLTARVAPGTGAGTASPFGPALAEQLDLRELQSPPGARVFENTAWVPGDAVRRRAASRPDRPMPRSGAATGRAGDSRRRAGHDPVVAAARRRLARRRARWGRCPTRPRSAGPTRSPPGGRGPVTVTFIDQWWRWPVLVLELVIVGILGRRILRRGRSGRRRRRPAPKARERGRRERRTTPGGGCGVRAERGPSGPRRRRESGEDVSDARRRVAGAGSVRSGARAAARRRRESGEDVSDARRRVAGAGSVRSGARAARAEGASGEDVSDRNRVLAAVGVVVLLVLGAVVTESSAEAPSAVVLGAATRDCGASTSWYCAEGTGNPGGRGGRGGRDRQRRSRPDARRPDGRRWVRRTAGRPGLRRRAGRVVRVRGRDVAPIAGARRGGGDTRRARGRDAHAGTRR